MSTLEQQTYKAVINQQKVKFSFYKDYGTSVCFTAFLTYTPPKQRSIDLIIRFKPSPGEYEYTVIYNGNWPRGTLEGRGRTLNEAVVKLQETIDYFLKSVFLVHVVKPLDWVNQKEIGSIPANNIDDSITTQIKKIYGPKDTE